MASLLPREHNAHLITGDVAMLTSMKLGLATTLAALSIAAVTFAGADVTSAQSTSVASAPVSYTLEAQVQTLRECDTDLDYLDSFEGMLSDLCALPELPKAPGQPRE
jgi:Na+/H+ antiporter NhaC